MLFEIRVETKPGIFKFACIRMDNYSFANKCIWLFSRSEMLEIVDMCFLKGYLKVEVLLSEQYQEGLV